MNAEDLGRYRASRPWAILKRQVRERARGICERCKQRKLDHVHHLSYARPPGQELLEDLWGLCRPCHEYLSAYSDIDPLTIPLDMDGQPTLAY